MTIEDVAEKADIWSEAIKKIVKAVTAAVSYTHLTLPTIYSL